MTRLFPLFLSVSAAVGCRTAPRYPIPDPLPETLEWSRPDSADGPAFLGLEVRENESGGLESLSFDPGVRVVGVAPASPAAEAGFAVGDVLLDWDGMAIDDPSALAGLLLSAQGDAAPRLRVQRGDSVFEVPVVLRAGGSGVSATLEPAQLAWRLDPSRSRAGWLAGRGGVVLVTTDPKGPFAKAGLLPGSVVTELDGVPFRSERAFIRALQAREPGERVSVTFRPAGAAPGDPTRSQNVRLFGPSSRVLEATLPVIAGYRSSVDGSERSFYLLDLWVLSLFKYRRDGEERHWSVLRFLRFSSGVGELAE